MPRYSYRAVDRQGRFHRGLKDAANAQELARLLGDEEQIHLISYHTKRLPAFARRLALKGGRDNGLITLCFHLAHLEQAGVPLLDGLLLLSSEATSLALKQTLEDISQNVREGSALSYACAQHPYLFNEFFVAVLRMCEQTGKLGDGLLLLQNYLQTCQETRWQITSSLRYPCILGCVIAGVVYGLLVLLVPHLEAFMHATVTELPSSTRALLWLSHHAAFLCGVMAGSLALSLISLPDNFLA